MNECGEFLEWYGQEKAELLGGNIYHFHFIHHTFHADRPGIEQGLRGEMPATSHLIRGTGRN
jgi:hypothetical protein